MCLPPKNYSDAFKNFAFCILSGSFILLPVYLIFALFLMLKHFSFAALAVLSLSLFPSTLRAFDATPPTNLWLYLTTDKGVTALADYGNCSAWADQTPSLTGGAAHDVSQPNGNYQPIWNNNASDLRNGHPVMVFGYPNIANQAITTFFYGVGSPANGPKANLAIFVVAKNKSPGSGVGTIVSTGISDGWQLRFNGANTLEFLHNGTGLASLSIPGGWHIFELRQRKGTVVKLGVDGAFGTADNGSPTTLSPVTASSTGILSIGAQATVNSPLIGQIAELLVYSGGNAPGDRKTILTQLGNKYGINVSDPVPIIGSVSLHRQGKNVKDGATLVAPVGKLQFSAPAVDDSEVTQVAFYNKGTLIGTGTNTAGIFNLGVANWPVGTYKIAAIATDDLGSSSSPSGAINFTIVNGMPKIIVRAKATKPVLKDGVTTSKLSVTGSWFRANGNDGSAALTYTWSVTGTPPADVTFAPDGKNGTPAAHNLRANFTAPGTYTLNVHIVSPPGDSVDGQVSVVVP